MALNSGCDKKQETKSYSVAKPTPEAPVTPAQSDGTPAAMPPGHPSVGGTMGGGTGGMPPGHPSMGGAMGGGTGGMPPGHPSMGGMSAGSAPSDKPAEISTGTPPPQWEAQASSQMRLASFLVKGDKGALADISLIELSGAAGGVLSNVNRWQSQLGQPNLSADELAKKAQILNSPLGEVTLMDIQGLPPGADAAKDGRIVAAIVSKGDMTYFFKMRGNAELVGAQKENFIQWIGTVRMAGAKAEADAKTPAPTAPSN